MAYSAIDVAKYIIKHCKEKELTVSNLKLQKLLYFVQAEFLVTKNEPCFEEDIEAWDFGPVVPVVYREYKIFGSANIPCIADDNAELDTISSEDKEIIDGIVDMVAPYSASQLVSITHQQDPWKNSYSPRCNNVITKASIKKFFE